MIRGVESDGVGKKGPIYSKFLAEGEIGLEVTGVGREVGGTIKLQGIHENRDEDRPLGAGDFASRPDESAMPLVQGPHRGDEGAGTRELGGGPIEGMEVKHAGILGIA